MERKRLLEMNFNIMIKLFLINYEMVAFWVEKVS